MDSAPIALIAKYPNESIGEAISSFSSSAGFPESFHNVLMVSDTIRINNIAQSSGAKSQEEARGALVRSIQIAVKTALLCWVSTGDKELTLAGLLFGANPKEDPDLPFIAAVTNSVVVAQYIRDAAVGPDKLGSIVPKSKVLVLANIVAESSFPQAEDWFAKAKEDVAKLDGSTSDSLYNIAVKLVDNRGTL